MDKINIDELLEKLAYTSLGILSLGTEKSKEILDEAYKAGQKQAEACKVKNSELKRKAKEKMGEVVSKVSKKPTFEDILASVEGLTDEQKKELAEKLSNGKKEKK